MCNNKDNLICEINSRIKTDCCNDKCNILHKTSEIDVKTGIGKLKNHIYDPVFDIMFNKFKSSKSGCFVGDVTALLVM